MIHELIYTSAEKGLQPGRGGFCTVATTAGIPRKLVQALESLSVYRHDAGANENGRGGQPEVCSFLKLQLGGDRYFILSRLIDAGFDYTGRTNYLAHHVAIESDDLVPLSPAALMARPDFFQSRWQGEPRILDATRRLPKGRPTPAPCQHWQQVTGDAGWAGALAQTLLDDSRPLTLIVRPEMPVLQLLAEAAGLLDDTWQPTFTTYFTQIPPGVTCAWRCVWQGSVEAVAAERGGQLVWDLCRGLGSPPLGPLTDAARNGARPMARSRTSLPLPTAREREEQPFSREPVQPLPTAIQAPFAIPLAPAAVAEPRLLPMIDEPEYQMQVDLESPPIAKSEPPGRRYRPRATQPSSAAALFWPSVVMTALLLIVFGGMAYWKFYDSKEVPVAAAPNPETGTENQPAAASPPKINSNEGKPPKELPATSPSNHEPITVPSDKPSQQTATVSDESTFIFHTTAASKEWPALFSTEKDTRVSVVLHDYFNKEPSPGERYEWLKRLERSLDQGTLRNILDFDVKGDEEDFKVQQRAIDIKNELPFLCQKFSEAARAFNASDALLVEMPFCNEPTESFLEMESFSSKDMRITLTSDLPILIEPLKEHANQWAVRRKDAETLPLFELEYQHEAGAWFYKFQNANVDFEKLAIKISVTPPFAAAPAGYERVVEFQRPTPLDAIVRLDAIPLIEIVRPLDGKGTKEGELHVKLPQLTKETLTVVRMEGPDGKPEIKKPKDVKLGNTRNGTQVLLRSEVDQQEKQIKVTFFLVHGEKEISLNELLSKLQPDSERPNLPTVDSDSKGNIAEKKEKVRLELENTKPSIDAKTRDEVVPKGMTKLDQWEKELRSCKSTGWPDVKETFKEKFKELITPNALSDPLKEALEAFHKAVTTSINAEKARSEKSGESRDKAETAVKLHKHLTDFANNPVIDGGLEKLDDANDPETVRKLRVRLNAPSNANDFESAPPTVTEPEQNPAGKPKLPKPKPDSAPAPPAANSPLSKPGSRSF